jgi:hypothetical protein
MALRLTQPLAKISTRNISWGKRRQRPVHRADNLTIFMCRLSRYLKASTAWNTQGLKLACTRTALLFYIFLILQLQYISITKAISINNGFLVNPPPTSNTNIHKCRRWASLYKLCGPPVGWSWPALPKTTKLHGRTSQKNVILILMLLCHLCLPHTLLLKFSISLSHLKIKLCILCIINVLVATKYHHTKKICMKEESSLGKPRYI